MPEPMFVFCKPKVKDCPTMAMAGPVVLPGAGVPLHVEPGSHPKRMFGRVVVLVFVVVVLLQMPEMASARYHLDHVPVPRPEFVPWTTALKLSQLLPPLGPLLKQVATIKLLVPSHTNGVEKFVIVHPVEVVLRVAEAELATKPLLNHPLEIGLVLVVAYTWTFQPFNWLENVPVDGAVILKPTDWTEAFAGMPAAVSCAAVTKNCSRCPSYWLPKGLGKAVEPMVAVPEPTTE